MTPTLTVAQEAYLTLCAEPVDSTEGLEAWGDRAEAAWAALAPQERATLRHRHRARTWARHLALSGCGLESLLRRAEDAPTPTEARRLWRKAASHLACVTPGHRVARRVEGRELTGWEVLPDPDLPDGAPGAVLWSRARGLWVVRVGEWSEEATQALIRVE